MAKKKTSARVPAGPGFFGPDHPSTEESPSLGHFLSSNACQAAILLSFVPLSPGHSPFALVGGSSSGFASAFPNLIPQDSY